MAKAYLARKNKRNYEGQGSPMEFRENRYRPMEKKKKKLSRIIGNNGQKDKEVIEGS